MIVTATEGITEKLPEEFYLEGLHDDHEGFRLLFQGKEQQSPVFRLFFDSPLSYRVIDEGDYLKTILGLDLSLGRILQIKESEYLDWLHGGSAKLNEAEGIFHLLILTPNECIDVLCSSLPDIEWLN